jgi:hypothetical protein
VRACGQRVRGTLTRIKIASFLRIVLVSPSVVFDMPPRGAAFRTRGEPEAQLDLVRLCLRVVNVGESSVVFTLRFVSNALCFFSVF